MRWLWMQTMDMNRTKTTRFFSALPDDFPEHILHPLDEGAARLFALISTLDVSSSSLSPYSKRYFTDYQKRLFYSLECGVYILAKAAAGARKPLNEITLLDHGAGLGMICLLARASGFGKVVYSDVYDVSCMDAEWIGSALNLKADAYLCGQTQEIYQQARMADLSPDVVTSRNVVEHVYDLEDFFVQTAQNPAREMSLVVATTANPANFLVDQYTKRIQRRAELHGSSGKWAKERDVALPFQAIRAGIIREAFPSMNAAVVESLAKATRGMWKPDVLKAVSDFHSTGIMPPAPKHPTNTCDPLTGNRTEHLMAAEEYLTIARKGGWEGKVYAGFYNTRYSRPLFNLMARIANALIRFTRFRRVGLAPFVVFSFRRTLS
jgi:2-polyprenyl-3-methyl-5-hydroxy-6-metoxy-1,4-benzoquinol methylase